MSYFKCNITLNYINHVIKVILNRQAIQADVSKALKISNSILGNTSYKLT